MNWKQFIMEIRKNPKNFAKAIIENLNPPKYAVEEIKKLEWMCHFCWKPRIDVCNYCHRSVCEDHCVKVVGEKTKLEWFFCEDCQKTHDKAEILQKVKGEDEEFWREDREVES